MKTTSYKVRNIQWKRSKISDLMFQVGQVVIRGQLVTVFRGQQQEGWLTTSVGQF